MTTNHKELCERLISDIGKAILGEGTESLALVLSRCAALLQSQASRIAELQRELETARQERNAAGVKARRELMPAYEARIAELEKERDAAEKHAAAVSRENFDLEARIAELEKERDALKADAEGYRLIRAGRVYIEPQDGDGRVYVATSERGRYCKTADAFDAEIAAALQAEKETR